MTQMVHAEAVPVRNAGHGRIVVGHAHRNGLCVLAETLAVVGDNGGILAQSLAAGSVLTETTSVMPQLGACSSI